MDGLKEASCGLLATTGEALHVVHDKFRPKASLAGEEKIFLEGPGDGIGAGDLTTSPTMWDRVVGVAARDLATAIDAGGAVEVGVKDVES
jgi:hypothetical protein